MIDENGNEIDVVEEVIEETGTSEESDPAVIQDEEEDRVVTIGEEVPEEIEEKSSDPNIVKKLRSVTRGLEKKNKALQKQLDTREAEVVKPVELGEKPTLESVKYDDAKYEQELLNYYGRKRKVESQAAEKAKVVESQNKLWQTRQEHYVSLKQEHSFKDFSEAEETVSAAFSQTQQGIIIQGAEDAALLVYALGKNPKKLEELAKITDPVEFTFKVSKLEAKLKVTAKKAPDPEKRVLAVNSGGMGGNPDKALERLRAEADKSGDYTKVVAYNRNLRNKDN